MFGRTKYIDTEVPLTREQWSRIRENADMRWREDPASRASWAVVTAIPVVLAAVYIFVERVLGWHWFVAAWLGLLACMGFAAAGGTVVHARRVARGVRLGVRDHGFDVCLRCGYWRRGLPEGARCPECGAEESDE